MDFIGFKNKYEVKKVVENNNSAPTKPIISVCVQTYNHSNYIRHCLNSILEQQTNFDFEILLGEDASTDGTREICIEYAEQYPDKIRLFLHHRENNIKIGDQPTGRFNFLYNLFSAKGKYIALCEGDDYWTDPKKLQVQIDEMKKHPEVDMSFHPAYELIDEKKGNILAQHSNETKIFSTSEVILGGGGFCPTASIVFRKEVVLNLPDWYYTDAPVGDYFLQIFGAKNGGALYLNQIMSIYRRNHAGSWSAGQKDPEKNKKWIEEINMSMDKLNDYLGKQYENDIYQSASLMNFSILKRQDIAISYRNNIYDKFKYFFNLNKKLQWYFIFSKPLVYKILKTLKGLM